MACGLLAEDCIITHWMPVLDGHREGAGWRAPCPVCRSGRALSVQVKGRGPAWNLFCSCERAEIRSRLAAMLPGCVSARYSPRHAIDRDEIIALVLDKNVTVNALRLGCLRALGVAEKEAREKLAMPRRTYYDAVRILAQTRRSKLVRILALVIVRILAQTRRSAGG